MEIIRYKKIYIGISALLVVLSIVALSVFGLKEGMDFTGGSLWEIKVTGIPQQEAQQKITDAFKKEKITNFNLQPTDAGGYLIRFPHISEDTHQTLKTSIEELNITNSEVIGETLNVTGSQAKIEEVQFESVGPSIGSELRDKAYVSLVLVIIFIVIYVAWAFRKVSLPVASWKYGLVTVVALTHDVLIPAGIFAVLGHFLGYEVDTLFVTALLTILGFSVHDTIVVFDRIRENLIRHKSDPFDRIVNRSMNDTLARSINTSLTAIIVLASLFIFGGASIKNFVLTLILGIFFGTYSSIFLASPLLVVWHERGIKKA